MCCARVRLANIGILAQIHSSEVSCLLTHHQSSAIDSMPLHCSTSLRTLLLHTTSLSVEEESVFRYQFSHMHVTVDVAVAWRQWLLHTTNITMDGTRHSRWWVLENTELAVRCGSGLANQSLSWCVCRDSHSSIDSGRRGLLYPEPADVCTWKEQWRKFQEGGALLPLTKLPVSSTRQVLSKMNVHGNEMNLSRWNKYYDEILNSPSIPRRLLKLREGRGRRDHFEGLSHLIYLV